MPMDIPGYTEDPGQACHEGTKFQSIDKISIFVLPLTECFDRVMTASSKAFNWTAAEQPLPDQQILYMATRARGAPPRTVPVARPRMLALWTMLPPAVEAITQN
uniref:Uncharacterized protein n=1 Tax=Oryza rufipogon TaxID=4529 RepID=A0A0E0P4P7_ORYRU